MDSRASSDVRRLHATVHGRVQGVGFRASTISEARRLSLAGWVRNRTDGSVEVMAEGPLPKLRLLLAFLHQGPWGSKVTSVAEEWSAAAGAPMPFQARSTE